MRRRFFGSAVSTVPTSGVENNRIAALFLRAAGSPQEPRHEPRLEPRDEAVFLLTAAAEIEHALMAQYLFAAYSLRVFAHQDLPDLQNGLLQIAREEMGHLITIQNLLLLLGGPLNFNREHSPYASEIYPFRFKLEPVTLDSLAKYVVAESPVPLPAEFPAADRELFEQEIFEKAQRSNDGEKINHVGPIFLRLATIFEGELKDEDFRLDTQPYQATSDDWGYDPGNKSIGSPLIIETMSGLSPEAMRKAATDAIRNIGQQGEGFDLPSGSFTEPESHFERFFLSYQKFKTLAAGGAQLTWPLAENPNTSWPPQTPVRRTKMVEVITEAHASRGRITDPRARNWAHLFNLRYRLLLAYLSHFLRLDQRHYTESGDRTPRGLLLIWTFNEMRRLKKIAEKLVQLPKDKREDETQPFPTDALHAGPPFELPYTLNLPVREAERWRAHLDVSRAATRLIHGLKEAGEQDEFLDDLLRLDGEDQLTLQALANGQGVPAASLPVDFKKVVSILEESVHGFDIISDAHSNFWDRKTRDQFISAPSPPHTAPPNPPIIKPNPDGGFDPNDSPLIKRLEGRPPGRQMPRYRPPVAARRIEFIKQWIGSGCPDNVPQGQSGIEREHKPRAEPAPSKPPPSGALSFAADIKSLFRAELDRPIMLAISGFDLHKFEDVRDNADLILARLEDGTMPCDGAWAPDMVEKFRKWIADGKNP